MKKSIGFALVVIFVVTGFAQKKKPVSQKEKVSYSIGVNIGKNMQMQEIEIDQSQLIQGLKDGLSNAKTALTDKEMEETMKSFQEVMMNKMNAKQKVEGEKNMKVGQVFLAENKKKEGVVTLPSGLQYKIITQGNGPKPSLNQTVRCHYRGTLVDGREFDSSYERGEPTEFPVSGVIKGWTEALQLMPTGSKWQLFIPSDLAYGPNGAGQTIGPNATLIFDIELIAIK
jgi:FKBP-type peptidyl-prolyl cis-trans isomerase FklB